MFVFASCGTQVNYLGSNYPSTTNIDVFVTQSSITKPFEIIGKGYVRKYVGPSPRVETIQRKAVEKAKSKGADGVVIEDYYLLDKTSGITARTDSIRTHIIDVNPALSSGFTILFIRYKGHAE